MDEVAAVEGHLAETAGAQRMKQTRKCPRLLIDQQQKGGGGILTDLTLQTTRSLAEY